MCKFTTVSKKTKSFNLGNSNKQRYNDDYLFD